MSNKTFWADATERAVKTGAQAELLALGASTGLNLFTLDWKLAIGTFGGGMLLSYITSLASASYGSPNSASLVVNNKELK